MAKKRTKTQECIGITLIVTSALVFIATLLCIFIIVLPSKPFVYDIKDLSANERHEVVEALLKMKETPSAYDKNYNAYDYFVELHYRATVPKTEIHGSGYLFFPWHREMQSRLHKELQRVSENPRITLPYWNWEDEASTDAIMLPSYLGAKGTYPDYVIQDGPFGAKNKRWKIHEKLKLPTSGDWMRSAPGNGLQMCLDGSGKNYFLDTPFNPPSVDHFESVGPFLYLPLYAPPGKDGPPKVLVNFQPRADNLKCSWEDLDCVRYYDGKDTDGTMVTLKCKHFAPTPQPVEQCEKAKQFLPSDPKKVFFDNQNPFHVAPAYDATSDENWAVCIEGNNPKDKYAAGLERLGASLHNHGSVHTSVGGSLATPFSPNNPLFGHLHGNIDRIWALHQEVKNPASKYVNGWWETGPGKDKLKTEMPLFENPKVTVEEALMMDKVPFRYAQPGLRSHAREIANGIWIWLCLIFVNLAWISCFYRKHYMANKDQTEISRKLSVPLMTQPDNNVEDGLAKTDGDDKNRNSWK